MSVETLKQLLTRHESAAYITTCLRTLDEKIASGDIPVIRIGKAIRIRRSALDAFLEASESRANPKRRKRATSKTA